jgi:3-dehydroquinate synthetase
MLLDYQINKRIYYIRIGSGLNKFLINDLKKEKNDKKILFIYDINIDHKLIEPILKNLKKNKTYKIFVLKIIGGKHNKNHNLLFQIINILAKKNFTKKSCILSVGGGVAGDVSAMAASLYMRGMLYFHIPTTSTSILDSCIGGKTAINFQNRINLLGTYYHPNYVYICKEIVNKIPKKEYLTGFAEAIKCGLLGNKNILFFLKKNKNQLMNKNFFYFNKLCALVLKVKIKFFINDVFEKNKRLFLNFGHSFAHALESCIEKNKNLSKFNHGEAVSVGMLFEMEYANTNKFLVNKIKKLLLDFNLPTHYSLNKKYKILKIRNEIYNNIFLDKKKISKNPRYIKILNFEKKKISEFKDYKKLKDLIKKFII